MFSHLYLCFVLHTLLGMVLHHELAIAFPWDLRKMTCVGFDMSDVPLQCLKSSQPGVP
jgi:hypothetical protein